MIFYNKMAHFTGFEFAIFRLREGVSEEQLTELFKKVDDEFLSTQKRGVWRTD